MTKQLYFPALELRYQREGMEFGCVRILIKLGESIFDDGEH